MRNKLGNLKYLKGIFICFLLFIGCSLVRNPEAVKLEYKEQIIDWQKRQSAEGWTIGLVEEIVRSMRWRASYVSDEGDHWDTFREAYNKGFRGDCEDIAVAIIGTLKSMGYPYKAKIRIVTTMMPSDHAIALIEMPDGEMREYNSIHSTFLDMMFYRTVCDFDENTLTEGNLKKILIKGEYYNARSL